MNIKLFCEYLQNPIGLDMESPRFTWVFSTDRVGLFQQSYHLLVWTGNKSLDKGTLTWDTGKVLSDRTINIPYNGERLVTAETYYYKVIVGTSDGMEYESEAGTFTMGIMEENAWNAEWLGGPLMEQHTFWFRNRLDIKKEVSNAYLYVASPCYYCLTFNGERCTDAVLNNAFTDVRKTILYATYSVTDKINKGENAIGIELGNGWSGLEMSVGHQGLAEHYFSLQMYITYKDGTSEWIGSKTGEWHYTTQGPVLFNSIYHGEIYDACRELTGWDRPDYDMKASGVKWSEAVEFEPPEGKIRAQILEPIKVVEQREPVAVYELPDGSYTFDMGQNFAGWARLKLKGKRGTEIRLEYAELMHPDHTLNKISLRGVRATDTYILKGEGTEQYEPRFTYHGFRYVQVFGLPGKPKKDTVIGCVVRSAVERIGDFNCGSELLNKLQSNIVWTEASNLFGIPTDCPQRDERLGWLNDMTVRNEGAIYSYRLPQLYTKWLQDIRDTQGRVTGAITDTAPFLRYGIRPADPVSSSFLLIPWNIYCHYGDEKIIRDNYEPMKRWVEYLMRNSTDYILRYSHMGDWAAPIIGTSLDSVGGGAVSVITPTQLMATGFLYYDCILMSKMAGVVGAFEDKEYYLKEAVRVKEAFQKAYYHPEEKYYYSNSQACNTFPLYLGITPEADRKAVLEHLVRDIVEKNNTHITTGNLCSRYINEVLFTNGLEDLAYELLTQTTYPSWGYMVENGATTMWERWEHVFEESVLSNMASHSHPMNGAFGVSFYKYLAGIKIDENNPGWKNILIKPVVPKKLKAAEASVDTLRGRVFCGWQVQEDNRFEMTVQVPFNCTAEVTIPISETNRNTRIFYGKEEVYSAGEWKKNKACTWIGSTDASVSFKVTSGRHHFVREGI